ncbi:MAG: TSCPD domain-containing protein [Mariprofundaceae bacterium]|nr:TSCPD domain-containing protein [Mariprofundaceae bacterium]
MMVVKIAKKITAYEVVNLESKSVDVDRVNPPLLERDEILEGSTYKIKTPASEHAMYITINDVIIYSGTADEHRRPFEIFINSKNMEHFMWIVALTRVISAIFRKGGDVTFLVEELKAVFDPRGGYFKKGGRYMPSLVAEIGEVIQQHLISIGMLEGVLDTAELKAKKLKIQEKLGDSAIKNASQCPKCVGMSLVRLDGCETCVECGYSKCG